MSQNQLLPRQQVDKAQTWDLTALFASPQACQQAQIEVSHSIDSFVTAATNDKLSRISQLKQAILKYDAILAQIDNIANYAELQQAEDLTDTKRNAFSHKTATNLAHWQSQLTAFETYLTQLSADQLTQLKDQLPNYHGFLTQLARQKKIQLNPATEAALATLQPALDGPSNIYSQARSADMAFPDFEVAGKTYPLSFTLYEDHYAYHPDTQVRRQAFKAFSKTLAQYQNTVAQAYLTQVTKEKQLATLRGFDSVMDYLLYDQNVDRQLFDRQIDLIMTEFGPVMQKYLKQLQKTRQLDTLTFADRLIDFEPDFGPTISIDASKQYIADALKILGPDYQKMILKAYPDRWVDYPQNIGKETGGFCAQPYGKQPYILLSWHNQLSDLYTLIHELGHAGQGLLAQQNHPYLDFEPSTYIIEAPSTFNELLLTHSLLTKAKTGQEKRFALTKMLANTYFHNFVTHLLEAAYQREVYTLIDNGETFDAKTLNTITLKVFKQFFGDALTLTPGTELTWMRQIHYYLGLYSYTYSASLTVSTQAYLRLIETGQNAVDDWLTFLKLGNTQSPIAAAATAGIDITTDQPLKNTIAFLNQTVDEIIKLS